MSITRINNNVAAINANRHLASNGRILQKSIERLSSGLRINRSADDAAGLSVATRIRSQVKGLDRAVMNAQDGINVINVAEGAMEEMIQRLDRIRVLSIQAANTGVNDLTARQAIQDEIFQSIDEITRIANTTQYSQNFLLNGDFGIDTAIKPGQGGSKNFGIHIDTGSGSSTLESGSHFLNIRRLSDGYGTFVAGLDENGFSSTMHSGVTNGTDIAISLARFSKTNLFGAGVNTTDRIAGVSGDRNFFNGVSIQAGDLFTFEGVLADGVTRFSGSISIGSGAGFTFGNSNQASANSTQLLGAINHAIDSAEKALFGVNSSNAVPSAYRTTVTLIDTTIGGANEGRLMLFSDGEFVNQSTINISMVRSGKVVTQSSGVTRSGEIGGGSALSGVGQIGNAVTAITGSTFGTGDFEISIEDVQGPQNRVVKGTIAFRDSSGAIIGRTTSLTRTNSSALKLNGTFVDGIYTAGVSISNGDTLTLRGTEADGTTFTATYTISNDPATDLALNDFRFATISGLISELNYRTRDYTVDAMDGRLSRFESALFTLDSDGKLTLIDDLARDNSKLDFTITFNDGTTGATTPYSIQDKAQLVREGFAEAATFRLNGGPAIRATAGEVVTIQGKSKTKEGSVQEELTFRVGSGLKVGKDIISVEEQRFVGQLNGGLAVTFQNGAQDVVFIDNQSMGNGVARYLTLDFDGILDITRSPQGEDPGTTLVISVVNRSMNFHIGAFEEQSFQTAIGDLTAQNLGFGRGSGRTVENIDVTTITGANEAIRIVDQALVQINRTRSLLGAATNRLEGTVANLSVSSENLLASESRLRDADLAHETTQFTQRQILLQANVSVLAQVNFLPQNLLSLLGG
ncbi:MAG: flagellin [bacterium]|jgi:flagellin